MGRGRVVSSDFGYLVGGAPYGSLRCRGLWWAGARVLIPIFSPPPSGFFLQGSKGASSYTPLGSIVVTLVLSGSTPGVLGDQPKILVRGLATNIPLYSYGLALLLCSYCSTSSVAQVFICLHCLLLFHDG